MINLNFQKGFIALFSVIIISFVLLLLTVSMNFAGFAGRFNIFDSESKERSNALANGCLEKARLAIATEEYTPNVQVPVDIDGEDCNYKIHGAGDEITAWTNGINKAQTFYWAKVDIDDFNIKIVDFRECLDLPSCD